MNKTNFKEHALPGKLKIIILIRVAGLPVISINKNLYLCSLVY